MGYKYCIVPMCTNTSIKNPEKCFINVPRKKDARDKWCKAIKRDPKKNKELSATSPLFVCEDHFHMEKDMENFMRYKMVGGSLRIKVGVVPHIFDCQKPAKISKSTERLAKRQRKELVDDLLCQSIDTVATSQQTVANTDDVNGDIDTQPMSSDADLIPASNLMICRAASPIHIISTVDWSSASFPSETSSPPCPAPNTPSCPAPNTPSCPAPSTPSWLRQPSLTVRRPHHLPDDFIYEFSDTESEKSESSDEYVLESEFEDTDNVVEDEKMRLMSRKVHMFQIETDPQIFLGIPKKCYFLVAFLSETAKCSTVDIFITIRKIKLNDSFVVLSKYFGMSVSNISRIFRKTVFLLANVLQSFIVWPANENIRAKLPIAFSSRYCNVQSIIDCFEIQVEKPSNPEHQALTWSSYYNCNTIKYLVSMTPDGVVSFISRGYGGRISDLLITEDSGYLKKLSPGMSIMADRGFKFLSACLEQRGCKLVRPPSVSEGEQCTRQDVLATKRIASVRIHVERLIGRFRLFKMLLPHACADNHLIPLYDQIVLIAAAIINIHPTLIKH